MSRRIVLALALATVVLATKTPSVAQAAERLDVETIKMGLDVSDEENNGFVERVVRLMNRRRLSRESVTIAFAKARTRTKHKFQYFKYAMIELADREGVSLDRPSPRRRSTTNWWQTLLTRLRSIGR